MQLEKILEEIDQKIAKVRAIPISEDEFAADGEEIYYNGKTQGRYEELIWCRNIILKHINDGWIPVDKNNVPDHEILACDRYGNELIGYLSCNADSEEFVCESDECVMHQVIAWMEKPEPYHPESETEKPDWRRDMLRKFDRRE